MKIQSIIERKNGTIITMDDETYHFKPARGDGRHICEVVDKAHIARFLSIPEGFRIPDDEDTEGFDLSPDDGALQPGSSEQSSADDSKPVQSTPRRGRKKAE